jgi:DNA (cytosine-5)-methyltransferase 1
MINTFASLFSGGGGADVGAIQAGLKPIWGIEYNVRIAEYYSLNIGTHCTVAKVQDVSPHNFQTVDWLHASPVCKNFSTAKTDSEETDEDMAAAKATANFIRVLMPKVFSFENVYAYRNSRSFAIVLAELKRLGYRWQFEHVCAADYGVPQTRMRLILIATRKDLPRYQWPSETHHDGSGYQTLWGEVKPWIGWYSAIEDLIPTLPESKFADWQLKRLPETITNLMLDGKNAGQEWGKLYRDGQEPIVTLTAGSRMKAFLIPGDNASNETVRFEDEPMATVRTRSTGQCPARAFIVGQDYGSPNTVENRELSIREMNEPIFAVKASVSNSLNTRAFVLDGQSAFDGEGLTCRQSEERFFTLSASMGKRPSRAWLSQGRVVQMTPRALARFQSFPDWYQLPEKNALACEIVGNAVPCLMFQRFVEQAISQYNQTELSLVS